MYVEPLVGYRIWRIVPNLPRISAVIFNQLWLPHQAEKAICLRRKEIPPHVPDHLAPHLDCRCGFWAFDNYDRMVDSSLPYHPSPLHIRGIVAGWGHAIKHEWGFRSHHAALVAFIREDEDSLRKLQGDDGIYHWPNWTLSQWTANAVELAAAYNVPLLDKMDAEAYASTWGTPIGG